MAAWAGLITALVSAAAALIGVGLTLFFTGRREASRLEHEQRMKIREERLQVYATMARITKTIDPSQPPKQVDLGQALSEIEILSENNELQQCTRTLVDIAANTRKIAWDLHKAGKDLAQDQEFTEFIGMLNETRSYFVILARDDLRAQGSGSRRSGRSAREPRVSSV